MLLIVILIFVILKDENSLRSNLPFFVTLSIISVRLIPVVSNINILLSNLNYLEPALDKIFNNYKKQTKIINELNKDYETKINEKINEIELKNITFRYDNSKKEILNNINLKFLSGKIVNIVKYRKWKINFARLNFRVTKSY